MDNPSQIVDSIALTMGVAWASGINVYAVLLMLGLMAMHGLMQLPPDLQVLAHPWVIGAAGLMYLVEFFADKVPGIDTAWDTLHTFIRIPAGAILAAGAVGQVDPAMTVAAMIVGGTVSAGVHAVKTGTRIMVNASPEPFSNWTLSLSEDVVVFGGMWAALRHPWFFLLSFSLFLLASVWMLPKIGRAIRRVCQRLTNSAGPPSPGPTN